jgi:hypothetical protein
MAKINLLPNSFEAVVSVVGKNDLFQTKFSKDYFLAFL